MPDSGTDGTVLQWFNETQVAELSGLPGPLVAELVPRLPTLEAYCVRAELYDLDGVYKACMAALMMRCGIRMKYVRAAMSEPVAREGIDWCCHQWRVLACERNAETRPRGYRGNVALITSLLVTAVGFVVAVLLL